MKKPGQLSRHKTFPLVDRSHAMQRLVGSALANADHSWIIPIVVSADDRLELYSFFRKVIETNGRSDSERLITRDLPKIYELESDDATSLLIAKAEELPERHQQVILNYRHNFPVIMLAVKPGSQQVTQGTGWLKEFQDACTPLPLSWPTWAQRDADRPTIISLIRSRLSMPSGTPVPEFDDQAMEYLDVTPFDGTLSVERAIKDALQRYIQLRSTGPLTFRHFTAYRAARILLNRKDVPPISVIH